MMDAMDYGIASADPGQAREAAEVKRWAERIERARKHDEEALKEYARCRRYARGDSGFAVDDNIIGTFVDILVAFLYARDPDVDVRPAKALEPADPEALRDAAALAADQDPRVQAAAKQAASASLLATFAVGQPPAATAVQAVDQAVEDAREQVIAERVAQMQAAFRRRQREHKAFGETLELVVSRLWRDARLKARARPWVQSALTIGVGWLKASWQERTGQDPTTLQKISDLRDNIARAAKLREDMDAQAGAELDATVAAYEQQLKALEGQVERVLARGFAADMVPAEDITVAPGVEIPRYLDAQWISHRMPMLVDDIVAEFGLDKDKAGKIRRYTQRKPTVRQNESALVAQDVEAKDADAFVEGQEPGDWGMVHEIWDRDANCVRVMVEGLDCWVRTFSPLATTRFYPFFACIFGAVDGQRHPQSLVTRSAKLVDEYNRIATAERDHRSRIIPKVFYLKGQVNHDTLVNIEKAETGEYVGVELTQPNVPLGSVFWVPNYPGIDQALYDRSQIVAALERLWGVQEALAGSITTDKTATEAQIQQSGMQARTNAYRDVIEDALNELAQYTAEVAVQAMDDEDVRAMVGPDAMWPELRGPEGLSRMVRIEIRAGSSGKPNTTAEREAWATMLPLLQASIQRIGALRNSTPDDLAAAEERLLRMTVERSGDRIDLETLLPKAGPAPMPGAMPIEPPPLAA